MTENFRRLTDFESALLNKLLSVEFTGAQTLREQTHHASVREIDEYGSLEFAIANANRADVAQRVPVEARALDYDGVPIEFMIHVVEGYLNELEVLKADGTQVLRFPSVDELDLFVYPE